MTTNDASDALYRPLLEQDESSFEQGHLNAPPIPEVVRDDNIDVNHRHSVSFDKKRTSFNEALYDLLVSGYKEEEVSCFQRFVKKLRSHWSSLRTPQKEEGLDFDQNSNKLYSQRLEEIHHQKNNSFRHNVEVMRWFAGLVIALIVSSLAIGVDVSVEALSDHKFDNVRERLQEKEWMRALWYYVGYNAMFVGFATLLVAFLDVKAKGSGVPEIKSYLNGRKIHRVISIRTLLSKLAGVIFSVSGSLILGKEGPMMHAGAVVGAIISQGRDEFNSIGVHMLSFRSDAEKRSFVSIGCACGVAAAFSAPLGGVLFVIEEAASYWSVRLTWLTFFATMVCAAFVDVVISGVKDTAEWGLMSQSAVVSFGSFEGASRDECYPAQPPYRVLQIPIFMIVGAFGGLAGALFNSTNIWISRKRMKYVVDPTVRVVESLLMSLLTSFMLFGLPYFYKCRSFKSAKYAVWTGDDPATSGANQTCSHMRPLDNFCDEGEFSDLETFMVTSLDSSVKHLFHSELLFEYSALVIYCLSVFFLACVTYGTSIPSGLFVPAITMGAAFGRIIGQLLWDLNQSGSWAFGTIDPGTYALIGGAAMLGGITRMTISIVVILMETTNNSTYAIPIMITIMTAKVVGDLFTQGLYDMHIELQGINFMHDEPPSSAHKLQVRHIMVKNPVVFNLFERASDIIETLQHCTHNGFPVVSNLNVSQRLGKLSSGIESMKSPPLENRKRPNVREFVSHRSFEGRSGALDLNNADRWEQSARGRNRRRRRRRRQLVPNVAAADREDEEDESEGFGVFEGTILRSQLLILLYEKVFVDDSIPLMERMQRKDATIHWREFFKHYPRSPSIRDVCDRLNPADFQRVVDLRPYLNSSALSVHHSVYLTRVHQLFRQLGLRHLTIVNTLNQVVGIVTRHELSHGKLEKQASRIVGVENAKEGQEEEEEDEDEHEDEDDIVEDEIGDELAELIVSGGSATAPARVVNSWNNLQSKMSKPVSKRNLSIGEEDGL